MASEQHLAILKKGVEAWNAWREEHSPWEVHMHGADPSPPDLSEANLSDANLIGVNLSGANLSRAHLCRTHLAKANLSEANLTRANLIGADLILANLTTAVLTCTDLASANLSGADLWRAGLIGANLRTPDLTETNLAESAIGDTLFADCDLSVTRGLEIVRHFGPCTIGIDTLYRSGGKIPDSFLRGCGIPEYIITDVLPVIRSGPRLQWHSSFIAHSGKDEEFARQLYGRMRQANLRVWFAPEDLKGGRKLHEQLFDAIQIHDRLLLVLSEHSMQSEWVTTEIRKAREVERKENRRKLFPIRLCSFDQLRDWTCFDADSGNDLAVEVREYFIPDFSNWKDHDAFEKEFEKLHRDLKADQKPKRIYEH